MSLYTGPLVRQYAGSPRVIVEGGTCNGEDTLEMLSAYSPDRIITFEANPENLRECQAKLGSIDKIQLVGQALSDVTGSIQFFPGDRAKCQFPNGGISSMFPFEPGHENFVLQAPVTVPCTRLDDFLTSIQVPKVDMLCLDIQGAELLALRGMGRYLADVKVVVCEVWSTPYYRGTPRMQEVISWMATNGFGHRDLIQYADYGDLLFYRRT